MIEVVNLQKSNVAYSKNFMNLLPTELIEAIASFIRKAEDLTNWLTSYNDSNNFGDLLLILELRKIATDIWPILVVDEGTNEESYKIINKVSKYYQKIEFDFVNSTLLCSCKLAKSTSTWLNTKKTSWTYENAGLVACFLYSFNCSSLVIIDLHARGDKLQKDGAKLICDALKDSNVTSLLLKLSIAESTEVFINELVQMKITDLKVTMPNAPILSSTHQGFADNLQYCSLKSVKLSCFSPDSLLRIAAELSNSSILHLAIGYIEFDDSFLL